MVKIDKLVIYVCKVISALCSILGGGSALPGKIALKIRPDILKTAKEGYKVVMVTGTNGKTTTSALITGILKNAGLKVISNTSGANMIDGIVTCFIKNYKKGDIAVIECDEAYTRVVNRYIKPEFMVITNVFKDQMDRFGEVSYTWGKIKDAILLSPDTTLLFNGDLPLFGKLDFINPTFYFGFNEGKAESGLKEDGDICENCGEKYKYNFITAKNLGDYYCPKCKAKRPTCKFTVDAVKNATSESSEVLINGVNIKLSVAGIYNIYNALAAYSLASLMGIEKSLIKSGIEKQQSCFGRDEVIMVEETPLQISLVKNPTGCDLCLDTVSLYKDKCNLLFMLNDNWGDGKDISWVWEASVEKLLSMDYDKIIIGGTRYMDMALRLKYASFPEDKFILCKSEEEVIKAVKNAKNKVFGLCTYTAMTSLRKNLHSKGFVKEMWK